MAPNRFAALDRNSVGSDSSSVVSSRLGSRSSLGGSPSQSPNLVSASPSASFRGRLPSLSEQGPAFRLPTGGSSGPVAGSPLGLQFGRLGSPALGCSPLGGYSSAQDLSSVGGQRVSDPGIRNPATLQRCLLSSPGSASSVFRSSEFLHGIVFKFSSFKFETFAISLR